MSINKDQARMLTALALACRPVGAPRWDDEGTFRCIGKLQHWSLPIAIEHVIRHAADEKAKTPGVIGSSHTPPELGMPTPGPMRRGEECQRHIGERAEKCPWCVHGLKGWDEDESVGERMDRQTALQAARAALVAAKHSNDDEEME